MKTFQDVSNRCLSASIAKKKLLRGEVNPAVGKVPISDFGIGDARRVLDALPDDAVPSVRRAVFSVMTFVLDTAIERR